MAPFPLVSAAALALCAAPATAQQLLVVESTNDHVLLLDAFDGTVLDPTFIDLNAATPAPSTPIEAVFFAGEIWVSDQVADTIFRFSLDGKTFIGTGSTGRDNMRGIGVGGNGSLYVSNSGTGGAGYGDVVKEYLDDGSLANVFPAGDPFDVVDFCGQLLVANIAGDDIDRFAYDGTFLGAFHDSDGVTGIDFPEQITLRKNGNVLAAGFSAPSGIFEYDWQGNQLNYYDAGSGLRGVQELGNGKILFTSGSGILTFDPVTAVVETIVGGVSGRFVTLIDGTIGTNFCMANPNSTGEVALISATGSTSLGADDVTLRAATVPDQFGQFFYSDTPTQVPFGDGFQCAGGGVVRLNGVVVGSGGEATLSFGPGTLGLIAGDTNFFQYWYRDPAAMGAGFNTSNGLCLTWRP